MRRVTLNYYCLTEINILNTVVVVESLSCVQLFVTSWTAACQAPLSSTISWSLLILMSIESVMLSNYLILCHSFSFCLQSFPASGSFPMNQLFTSVGKSIGALASVLPVNIQGWFPLRLTALWSSNPTAGHTHWGNQKGKRHVYPNVHRSTVYNSQDMETT